MCVCVCVCIWNARRHARACPAGVPEGHARRSCPKGTPEGRVLKGPRRGHCGRRPPGGAGGGEGGGGHPPIKNFTKIFFSPKNLPKGPLRPQAARGRWRGGEGRGVTPSQKIKCFTKKTFLQKNFPKGPLQVMLERGGEGGVTPPKKIHEKFCFRQKIPRKGHCSLTPPGGATGGKEMGGSSPPSKKTGREAPHNYLVRL